MLPSTHYTELSPLGWAEVFSDLDAHAHEWGYMSRVAGALGCKVCTLSKRYAARRTTDSKPGPDPRLGAMEGALVTYVKDLHDHHNNKTVRGLRDTVMQMADEIGLPEGFVGGRTWAQLLMKRHKDDISLRKVELSETSRAKAVSSSIIAAYFADLQEMVRDVPPNKIWNVDETGVDSTMAGRHRVWHAIARRRSIM